MMIEAIAQTEKVKGASISDAQPPKTVEEFEAWLKERPHLRAKNFEFRDGEIIERTNMKQDEIFIVRFLMKLFYQTKAFQNGGILSPETDSHISSSRKRVADFAFFTDSQIEMGRKGKNIATAFAIEILSPNDKLEEFELKVQDYFDSGTQIVWHISPRQKHIYVYTSPIEVKIYKGKMMCSAAPVVPDFSFKVEDMFLP